MLIGTAIVAGLSGYMIGIASSLGFFPIPFQNKPPKQRGIDNYDDEEESEEEDIEESLLDHAPNWANGVEADKRDGLRVEPKKEPKKDSKAKKGSSQPAWANSEEEFKLVLVVRTDLGMTKGMFCFPRRLGIYTNFFLGKIAAQCGHATLGCYKKALRKIPSSLGAWEEGGQAKVALQAKGEEELMTLQAVAQSLGIIAEVIHDAGRTQIASGSATVLGIGPAPKSVIDQVTGKLRLL